MLMDIYFKMMLRWWGKFVSCHLPLDLLQSHFLHIHTNM